VNDNILRLVSGNLLESVMQVTLLVYDGFLKGSSFSFGIMSVSWESLYKEQRNYQRETDPAKVVRHYQLPKELHR
jgi:hypothetical protein